MATLGGQPLEATHLICQGGLPSSVELSSSQWLKLSTFHGRFAQFSHLLQVLKGCVAVTKRLLTMGALVVHSNVAPRFFAIAVLSLQVSVKSALGVKNARG